MVIDSLVCNLVEFGFLSSKLSVSFTAMMKHLELQAGGEKPPTRDLPAEKGFSNANLQPAEVKVHPAGAGGGENASIFFVGTATTILLANSPQSLSGMAREVN